jgi:hypothetical protein
MVEAIRGILSSKKWLAILVAIAVAVLVQFGVIAPEVGNKIDLILGLGVGAQAMADHGKEAAKAIAAAKVATAATPPVVPVVVSTPVEPTPPPPGA